MIRRIAAFLVLVWAFGFIWFAAFLPTPAGDTETDAVVVPTGGPGRIDRGLEVLEERLAPAMLVSGVDPEVKPAEFAREFGVPQRLMRCCVTLGQGAVDTRSNAAEIAQWVADRKAMSIRLVTTDWHMRRAASELASELPAHVSILRDAVQSEPSLKALFLEYHKLLASSLARAWADVSSDVAA